MCVLFIYICLPFCCMTFTNKIWRGFCLIIIEKNWKKLKKNLEKNKLDWQLEQTDVSYNQTHTHRQTLFSLQWLMDSTTYISRYKQEKKKKNSKFSWFHYFFFQKTYRLTSPSCTIFCVTSIFSATAPNPPISILFQFRFNHKHKNKKITNKIKILPPRCSSYFRPSTFVLSVGNFTLANIK